MAYTKTKKFTYGKKTYTRKRYVDKSVRADTFGNGYKLVRLEANKNGYPYGYFKIYDSYGNASMYRIDISISNEEGKNSFAKITRKKKMAKPIF